MPNARNVTYSFAQLEGLWIQAGGSRSMAPVMAAIALAESSGDPNAKNTKDNNGRQTSWGLWQISDGTHNEPVPNILDPKINAQEAVKKLSVQGLGAWGTYGGARYKQYLAQNTGVAPDTSNLPSGSTSTATPADSITGDLGSAIGEGFAAAFTALLQPLIATFLWGGEIILGIALMVGGIVVFILNTDAGKNATSKAGSMAVGAAGAAAPELSPALAEAIRLRNSQGRRAAVRQRAREAARKTRRGQQVAAQQREKKVQQASRRNRANSSAGNS